MDDGGDTDDQKRLREVVLGELRAVLEKHDVAGTVMIVSRDSAAWTLVLPRWAGLIKHPQGLRVKFSAQDKDEPARGSNTMHLLAALHEMSTDMASLFGRTWRSAKHALEAQGALITHVPLGRKRTVGGRPDPLGGKHD